VDEEAWAKERGVVSDREDPVCVPSPLPPTAPLFSPQRPCILIHILTSRRFVAISSSAPVMAMRWASASLCHSSSMILSSMAGSESIICNPRTAQGKDANNLWSGRGRCAVARTQDSKCSCETRPPAPILSQDQPPPPPLSVSPPPRPRPLVRITVTQHARPRKSQGPRTNKREAHCALNKTVHQIRGRQPARASRRRRNHEAALPSPQPPATPQDQHPTGLE
jgi:hypothetical protein